VSILTRFVLLKKLTSLSDVKAVFPREPFEPYRSFMLRQTGERLPRRGVGAVVVAEDLVLLAVGIINFFSCQ